jgi:serpin B
MNGFAEKEGYIEIPKYTIEFESRLKAPLKELGMGVAFSPSAADFSGMCTVKGENIFIDDVIHKTFVEVNEEGTEAAAATAVTMRLTSVAIKEEPFKMVVDRPFFVAIRDNTTGLILFVGGIADPRS